MDGHMLSGQRQHEICCTHRQWKSNAQSGEDGLVGHSDVIPAFSDTMYSSAMPPQDCKPRLQLRLDGARIGNVRLHTPEREDALELLWTIKEGRLAIDVPPRAFRGYAVIEAEKIC
jgi:hypothetical protein